MHIEHIGIAVNDLNESVKKYEALLGIPARFEKIYGMEIAILATETGKIELLASDGPDSPIGKFLAKKGEGIHHIAINVDDVKTYLDRAASLNVSLIDNTPKPGADDKMIAFLHPKDLNGVLLEFCMDKQIPD